jgi:Dimerisation domain
MDDAGAKVSDLIFGRWRSQILYAGVQLGVFDALACGPRSAASVAIDLEVDAGMLYRLMRALGSLELLHEDHTRTFSLTPMDEWLCRDHPHSQRGMTLLEDGWSDEGFCQEWWTLGGRSHTSAGAESCGRHCSPAPLARLTSTTAVLTRWVKSRRPISNAMEVSFSRGMARGTLTFKPRMQDRCGLFFQHADQLEIDDMSGDRRDSRSANLQALHGHCHDAKTREQGADLPGGMHDKHRNTEERSARKRARSVLEQR